VRDGGQIKILSQYAKEAITDVAINTTCHVAECNPPRRGYHKNPFVAFGQILYINEICVIFFTKPFE